MTLSGSDKANDLLSSQIDSLICLLYQMKVNDKESFQTLPFKLLLEKKPVFEKWIMIKAWNDSPGLNISWPNLHKLNNT